MKSPEGKFVPDNKTHFTQAETDLIRRLFYDHTNRGLLAIINLNRDQPVRLTVLRTYCYSLGLRHTESPIKWTHEQFKYLVMNYQTMGDVELAENLNKMAKGRQHFTKKKVNKKRQLFVMKRTPEQVAKICQNNVKAGRHNTSPKRWQTNETKNQMWL